MIKSLLVFFLILFLTTILFCSSVSIPLFDYVDRSDIVIQGILTHIDYYSGDVMIENINSMRDTAYIKINKIYKNNSDNTYQNQDSVKLLIPTKYGRTRAGFIISNFSSISHNIGKNGIWLLKEKDNAFYAGHHQAFQLNSKEELIQELCKIKPQVLKFLNGIFWSNISEVRQSLKSSMIDPTDSIFYYNETNPLLLTVRNRKYDLIQDIIDYGFNINFKNADNENALLIAIKSSTDDLDIIDILLKNNIETDILNKHGVSITDLVNRSKNKKEILELFQKYKD